ncbi:nitrate reductase subunit beta, partial [Roseomonas sp. DSM 102946]|nr:nitrate reductase subunit beta [Roseomonas sp. DSM 102946]
VYKMACDWKVAFPLHPEYRTVPMVWYIPPLSPIQEAADAGALGTLDGIPDVDSLRIPVRYLANLLTAGKEEPIRLTLRKLLALRAYMRRRSIEDVRDTTALDAVGLTERQAEEMYRVMAIANYEDRFVIP